MATFGILIELLEPGVFSSSGASAGTHRSLDYIPGAALLGALSDTVYADSSRGDPFEWLHSGELSIGNAYPLSPSRLLTWPAPRSWHSPKGKSAFTNTVNPKLALDLAAEIDIQGQFEQLRGGFVSSSYEIVRTSKAATLKSAVDAVTRRAADAQLFSYESLEKDQSFVSVVYVHDDKRLDPEQVKSLFHEKEFRLGRSRSAEFGKVRTRIVRLENSAPTRTEPSSNYLSVWALSDLAVLDRNGSPTFIPDPSHFGWSCGEVDWQRTHLRTRSYTPYNAFLRSALSDRSVIEAGSVITFLFADPASAKKAYAGASNECGVFREAGLGRIGVGPALVGQSEWPHEKDFAPWFVPAPQVVQRAQDGTRTVYAQSLAGWAKRAVEQKSDEATAMVQVDRICTEALQLYEVARRYQGVPISVAVGPSASQWNAVAERLKQAARSDGQQKMEVVRAIFEGGGAIAGSGDLAWGAKTGAEKTQSFLGWLRVTLGPPPYDDAKLLQVTEAAIRISRGV